MKMKIVIPFLAALIFAVLISPAFAEMSALEEELLYDPLYHEMLYEDELWYDPLYQETLLLEEELLLDNPATYPASEEMEMPDDTVEMTEEMNAIEETEQVTSTEPIFSAEFVSLTITCSDTATAE